MALFKAAMAVAAILIGTIAAGLGALVTVSALSNGAIHLIFGAAETTEIVTRAASPAEFYKLVAAFGVAPFVTGVLAVFLGWRWIS